MISFVLIGIFIRTVFASDLDDSEYRNIDRQSPPINNQKMQHSINLDSSLFIEKPKEEKK